MDTKISSLENLESILADKIAVIIYFTSPACNVCKVLRPKLMEITANTYPDMGRYYVDISETPEISAEYSVFAAPTIIVLFDGKEFARKSRSMSPELLMKEIERPYSILTQ